MVVTLLLIVTAGIGPRLLFIKASTLAAPLEAGCGG